MRVRSIICLSVLGCGGGSEGPPKLTLAVTSGIGAERTPVRGPIDVPESGSVTLNAGGEGGVGEVSYTWTQVSPATPKGTFSSGGVQTTFTVPPLCADATLTLKVAARSAGQTAEATIEINAINADPAFQVEPQISIDSTSKLVGEQYTLIMSAQGPGCGPKFQWSQIGTGGTIESPTNESTLMWRAPAQAAQTDYQFKVTVTDEGGTQSQERTITLTALQPTWPQVAEMFENTCTNCHDGNPSRGAGVNFEGAAATDTAQNGVAGVTGGTNNDANGLCRGQPYVSHSGNPTDSVLYKRITSNDCGDRMPRNNSNFINSGKQYIIRLESWLRAQAPF